MKLRIVGSNGEQAYNPSMTGNSWTGNYSAARRAAICSFIKKFDASKSDLKIVAANPLHRCKKRTDLALKIFDMGRCLVREES